MLNAQLGLAQLLALGRPFLLAGGPAPVVKLPTQATLGDTGTRTITLTNSGVLGATLGDSGRTTAEVS